MEENPYVIVRVKRRGNKIGAAIISQLNKMGNPSQIIGKINELVSREKQKKVYVKISQVDKSYTMNIQYAGDAQVLRALPVSQRSCAHLNSRRREFGLEEISDSQYQGICRSMGEIR